MILGQEVDRELADRGDARATDLEPDHGAPDLLETERDRQSDVSETDDRDGRRVERSNDGREHLRVRLVEVHHAKLAILDRFPAPHRRGIRRINMQGH